MSFFVLAVEVSYGTLIAALYFLRLTQIWCNALSDRQKMGTLDGLRDLRLGLNDVAQASFDDEDGGLGALRHLHSRNQILEPDKLAKLTCISVLYFSHWQRKAKPSVQLDLAVRMAGVRKLELVLDGFEMRYPGFLRDDRNSLVTASHNPETTRTVADAILNMGLDGDAINQVLPMPSLICPSEYNHLSISLCFWLQQLTRLRVEGVLDGSLFWPRFGDSYFVFGMAKVGIY
ncbi:hypothetical protein SCAR479_01014 [Seiridium cardinale]|uniref:Uncharacterized protein n=1 Tax=Seiridium cardinale TaxID=138064 RepID=A0ABR2Y7G4_9PEZI